MGCSTSKLDNLPAVALCRDRYNFLEGALRQSYVLADAHLAYMQSLKSIGPALHSFFSQEVDHYPPSNGDPAVSIASPLKSSPPVSSPDHSPSSSNSDSHLHFDSDSDDDERDEDQLCSNYPIHGTLTSFADMFTSLNYSKHQPAESVSYAYSNHNDYDTYYTYRNYEMGSRTPPPPAPRSSLWDFLNLFEACELSYGVLIDKEPKEQEETHNLEDRSVKQTHRDQKFDRNHGKVAIQEDKSKPKDVEKKEKSEKEKIKEKSDSSESKNETGKQGVSVSELMTELQSLFEGASESGNEVLKMLDTGKFRYHLKSTVSSKILHMASPVMFSSSSTEKTDSVNLGSGQDVTVRFRNLSSTLEKLCMWEKKLYNEVKAEEKMRKVHGRKCRQIKRLHQKGADAHKVESTQIFIRTLSTRMRVAVHVIDKISITINKLRDEDLWPQISELIHRLRGMWEAMEECHRCQVQEIEKVKSLDTIGLSEKLELAMQLKLEMQNWNLRFSNWIGAQKGYVQALNAWLLRCLMLEPGETPEVKIGAPPVFVIVNQWSEATDRLSEKEVTDTIHRFSMHINQVLEQHSLDLQQKVISDTEMERKMLTLEKQEQKMQKLIQAREKPMTPLPDEKSKTHFHPSEVSQTSSLRSDLKHTFMAMERFAVNSKQAYTELHVHIQGDCHPL